MTRDEVIKALEYMISGECCDTQYDFIDEIEFAIADMKAMKNNCWINAKERLPEKPGQYPCITIINGVKHTQMCLWNNGKWFWVHDVRYWMPLPELPKEVEQDG